MEKINAVITGIGGYLPDYILDNAELSQMVDTNDEWIMTRVGIKKRHILNEEGLGSSYMARKACRELMRKTGANPDDAFSDVPYDKGYLFLKMLEDKYGREKFDKFLNQYFSSHAFQTMTTEWLCI